MSVIMRQVLIGVLRGYSSIRSRYYVRIKGMYDDPPSVFMQFHALSRCEMI